MSPLESFTPSQIILNNSIGGNVGNLIYAYSVYRTLMTEDTTIVPDYYEINPDKADEINETYDCYIIPLADAFRESFVGSLRKYTKLIKKLTIPVVVIGAGLRAPFEPKLNEGFPFDEDVKAFVKAVLEKSSMIGLRGEITSKYLSRLGFKEGVDHTVIGCPSMYTFGRELEIRKTTIHKDSMVCINSSQHSPKKTLAFMNRSLQDFPNHYFIPQWLTELKLTYQGSPSLVRIKENYPSKMSDALYMENKVRFFVNALTWIDFMKQADFSFGLRLHGNITATIAGTPSILIPKDARMRELAEYHNLTYVWGKDITDKTNINDLIEKADFQSPVSSQPKNFDHFIHFLDKNNLNHIYKNDLSLQKAPLDEALEKVDHLPPVAPISGCSLEEMVERWEEHQPLIEKKNKSLENRRKKYKAELDACNKELKKARGTLNRKSARIALKTANMFRFK